MLHTWAKVVNQPTDLNERPAEQLVTSVACDVLLPASRTVLTYITNQIPHGSAFAINPRKRRRRHVNGILQCPGEYREFHRFACMGIDGNRTTAEFHGNW